MRKSDLINLMVITGKILAPVGKVLLKVLKAAKVVKTTLIGVSLVAYSWMFTWQFAVLILVFLFVHEYGHLWAMKKYGMKTKGIYIIPFLGAAAVADDAFPSYENEVCIAMMGPIWGIVLAFLSGGLFLITGINLFAGAAIWMFTVTLFNLLPIMPLDGGRVFRCIAMSISSWGGIAVFMIGIMIAILLSRTLGIGLMLLFLIVGGIEVVGEFYLAYKKKKELAKLMDEISVETSFNEIKQQLTGEKPPSFKIGQVICMIASTKRSMNSRDMILSFSAISIVAVVSLWVLFTLESIPGAEMALNILKDK